ncbi:hypothetical protein MASR2M15_20940 [Anaerolineales bacterium]
MMSEEKILTLHPEGKQGVRIDKNKYDQIRQAILDVLKNEPDGFEFRNLTQAVGNQIGDFDGSLGWYVITIKLDLEARGEIKRLKGSPQRIQLK